MLEDSFTPKHKKLMAEIAALGIRDQNVLLAMERLPRHWFLPKRAWHLAYYNTAVGVDEGQSISEPYTVALMTQSLELAPHHNVLEIGTGTGYQAAILSLLVQRVYTIERHEKLKIEASERLYKLGIHNVATAYGDGMMGWTAGKQQLNFERIILTAAVSDEIPPSLIHCLSEGGIMVLPIGNQGEDQDLIRVRKIDGKIDIEALSQVRFVPLLSGSCDLT